MRLLSRLLISTGILCYVLGIYNIWLINTPNRLSFQNYTYAQAPETKAIVRPTKISIKNLNVSLPIVPAEITEGSWDTTDKGASYLATSPIPGESGNSVIYAHNWTSLFGNLTNIIPGDEVEIEFGDKSTKTFVVKLTSTVTPETTSILAPTNDKRITLYTCTGFLDSHRFVAVAILKDK